MGSAGSVVGNSIGVIDSKYLKESFDRNRDELHTLFFQSMADGLLFSDDLVRSNLPLLHWMLEDIANQRLKEIGDVTFLINKTETFDLFHDLLDIPDIVSSIEIDVDQLDQTEENINTSCCPKYALLAECIGLTDMQFFDFVITKDYPFGNKPVAVNISNNQLDDTAMQNCLLPQSQSILQINMGGNCFASIPLLPITLLFLDLSYSEDLKFTVPGMLSQCPQLLRLVLDGCALTSTVIPLSTITETSHEGGVVSSIFFGLTCLRELSMKENLMENVESLIGLQYFSNHPFRRLESCNKEVVQSAEGEGGGEGGGGGVLASSSMTLYSVNLSDNPISDNVAQRKAVCDFMTKEIPSVKIVDGKLINEPTCVGTVMDKSSVMYKQQHAVVTDSDLITDVMALEFAAALKGEKDNTVIS